MGHSRLRIWRRPSQATTILVAALSPIAALLSVAVGGGTATAAPAAGYTASFIPTGQSPFAVAVDAATDTAYFANSYGDEITVVDTSTNAVTATIGLAGQLGYPGGIAVDQVTDTIYVSEDSGSGPAVAVIDGETESVTATILLPGGSAIASGVAVDSSTDTIYVSEQAGVAVIDGSTNSVTTTVSTDNDQPFALAVDETTDVIWVAGADNNDVLAISGTSNSVIQTIAVGSRTGGVVSVAVDAVTDTVYAGILNDEVAVINGATGMISTTIATASTPDSIGVDPDSGTVFVSDNLGPGGAWGTTWVIDESSNAIVDTIDRGGWQIAVNAATGSVYEAPLSVRSADIPVTLGGFVLAPAAANAMSPMFVGSVPPLAVGTAGSSTIDGSALPAATYYSETGALPAGVTFNSSGTFSGTPAAGTVGTYSITVTASNGIPPDFTHAVSLTVGQAPTINSADQATFMTGVPGSFTVTTTGFPAPTLRETGTLPSGVTFDPSTGVLSGTPTAGTAGGYPIQITATNSVGSATQAFALTVSTGTGSSFMPAGPVRLLDTRDGTGGYSAPVGPGATISLQVTGTDGVPATGVTAVVLNVTATGPTAGSDVIVYPDGQPRPGTSNLNFTRGETIPNLVVVPVGADGKVDFYNLDGSVNLVADLAGYYTTSGTGSSFVPAGPVRLLDTRDGTGGYSAPVGPGATISLQVTGTDGVPASGVTAVVLNVTATGPTAGSDVIVYPDGQPRPGTSNLNFTRGETIPNLVIVPVGADGKVDFYNLDGSVNLLADLAGYYTTSGTGSSFVPAGPVRLLDTRDGTGGYSAPVGPGATISLQVTGTDGVPATGVTAVVLNVTATGPTAGSDVIVYPDGQPRPGTSNLNFTRGETIPNLVIVPVGADGKVDFYNLDGSVNLVADLFGYYVN